MFNIVTCPFPPEPPCGNGQPGMFFFHASHESLNFFRGFSVQVHVWILEGMWGNIIWNAWPPLEYIYIYVYVYTYIYIYYFLLEGLLKVGHALPAGIVWLFGVRCASQRGICRSIHLFFWSHGAMVRAETCPRFDPRSVSFPEWFPINSQSCLLKSHQVMKSHEISIFSLAMSTSSTCPPEAPPPEAADPVAEIVTPVKAVAPAIMVAVGGWTGDHWKDGKMGGLNRVRWLNHGESVLNRGKIERC